MDTKRPLRVTIVGGSVSGLTMAHMLERLGMDYVLLERGSEIAFAGGASIGLQPHALRIMDQLGCYEDILRTTIPMSVATHRRPDGKAFAVSRFARQIEKRHGYPILFFEREELLKILHNRLADKTKVLCSKKVVDIQSDAETATVTTADGSIYRSDFVIGADGVNSFTRQAMWKRMAATEPKLVEQECKAMSSEYACAFGVSIYESDDPELVPGYAHITYNQQKSSIVILSTRNKKFWFLILKHKKKHFAPNIPRYSLADAEAVILENKDWHMTAKTTIADLWEKKTKFTMVSLEEAVFQRWHEGRLVLLGDAVHKVTPNAGHGGNTAIESAVTLANLLHKAQSGTNGQRTNYTDLLSLFEEYQRSRQERVALASQLSAAATRLQAMDNYLWRFLGLHVIPLFGEELEANSASELILGGQPLEFVEYKGKEGSIPWEGWTTKEEPFLTSNNTFVKLLEKSKYFTTVLLATWIAWQSRAWKSETVGESNPLNSTATTYVYAGLELPVSETASIKTWGAVAACLNMLPIGVVLGAESLRRGNVKTLSVIPFFVACSLWYGGLACLGALFLSAYLVDLRLSPSRNPYAFVLPVARAKSLPIAVLLCTLVAISLPTGLFQLLWPMKSTTESAVLHLFVQTFPVLPLLVTEALSKLQTESAEAEKLVIGHPDMASLKAAYAASMIISALAHIVDLVAQAFGLSKTDPTTWASVLHFLLGATSLDTSMRNSYIAFTVAALVFVYSCTARELPARSQSLASKLKLALGMLITSALLGSGTAAAFLWIWREDKVRCDKLSPFEEVEEVKE